MWGVVLLNPLHSNDAMMYLNSIATSCNKKEVEHGLCSTSFIVPRIVCITMQPYVSSLTTHHLASTDVIDSMAQIAPHPIVLVKALCKTYLIWGWVGLPHLLLSQSILMLHNHFMHLGCWATSPTFSLDLAHETALLSGRFKALSG